MGQRSGPPLRKSQVAIGFLRNSGTDPLEKHLDPTPRVQLRLKGGPYRPQ